MPVYATNQDFIDRFSPSEATELTNLDQPNATTVNAAVLTRALFDASVLCDGYIAKFSTSAWLTDPPPLLKVLVLDVARYFLERIEPREDTRTRYEDALKLLGAIASGDADLGGGTDVTVSTGVVSYISGPQIFTHDSLSDYVLQVY